MNRAGIASLVLAVALSLSWAIATSASAASFGQCVAHKKGEYTEGSCLTKSAKPHKGKFEWVPGPAPTCVAKKKGEYTEGKCATKSVKPHKGKFETAPGPGFHSMSGVTTFKLEGVMEMKCAISADVGEVVAAAVALDTVIFEGCESPTLGGAVCTTGGEPPGHIKTALLEEALSEPSPGKVDTKFENVAGPGFPILEAECAGMPLTIGGSVTGTDEPGVVNKMSHFGAIALAGIPEMMGKFDGSPVVPTSETTGILDAYESEVEIKAP
jgi:hypothetical protein